LRFPSQTRSSGCGRTASIPRPAARRVAKLIADLVVVRLKPGVQRNAPRSPEPHPSPNRPCCIDGCCCRSDARNPVRPEHCGRLLVRFTFIITLAGIGWAAFGLLVLTVWFSTGSL